MEPIYLVREEHPQWRIRYMHCTAESGCGAISERMVYIAILLAIHMLANKDHTTPRNEFVFAFSTCTPDGSQTLSMLKTGHISTMDLNGTTISSTISICIEIIRIVLRPYTIKNQAIVVLAKELQQQFDISLERTRSMARASIPLDSSCTTTLV